MTGMKKGHCQMTNTNAAATDHMRRHVTAITRMLLGKAVMASGLAMTAGEVLNDVGVLRIAELAHASGKDIIHLDFTLGGETTVLRDIIIAALRADGCHVHRGCRLAQRPDDRFAVLLPNPLARGHFRVARDEIIHVHSKPAALVGEGVDYAARRLARLVHDDVDVRGQIVVAKLPQ